MPSATLRRSPPYCGGDLTVSLPSVESPMTSCHLSTGTWLVGRAKRRLHPGLAGEIISECRATSNPNGGRDHPGIPADFRRNQHGSPRAKWSEPLMDNGAGVSFTERLLALSCPSCSAGRGHAADRIQAQIRRGNFDAAARRAAQYRPGPPKATAPRSGRLAVRVEPR